MRRIYHSFWQISLVFGLTLFASNAQALECTPTPDCGSLGYIKTEADCQEADVVLKCPTDTNKMSCWTQQEEITIGAILYGDGTVSRKQISGKTPIGVVFDAENRLAVALTDVNQDGSAGSETMDWSSNICDVPNLENCEDETTVITTCGADGRKNTDAILAANGGCSGTTYAANAVNSYEPVGCLIAFCTQGKWFLPSQRDLNTIFSFESEVNSILTSLSTVGAQQLGDQYWSSTEYNGSYGWEISFGYTRFSNKVTSSNVRPVIAF